MKEEEEKSYVLTESGESIIEPNIETMQDWISSLDDSELNFFYRFCNKQPEERTQEENNDILKHSLVLYYRELDVEELGISDDLLKEISGIFSTNIIFESLRRRGMIELSGPLLIYKETTAKLTEKGREFNKKKSEDGKK
jgi:predicted transcriptional regulator